jgi:hypothetical protein
MPPRAKKGAKKPTTVKKQEVVPQDLEAFLIDTYDWPDVTDILIADGAFQEAIDQFSQVAEFRTQLKEALAPCYGRRRVSCLVCLSCYLIDY